MCGFVGIFSTEDIDTSVLKKMTDAIHHRGPDDEGYLVIGNSTSPINELRNGDHDTHTLPINIGFGHRRLSILDLSPEARQPMSLKDRYWIVFNGEIFNYIEIREELKELGYSFNTTCDTEVLIAAYDYWKEAMLPKLNGMWAFIIYDKQTQNVLISRDRFGIKPLHYTYTKSGIIFCSEIKGLLNHPDVSPEVNQDYIKHYLKYGPVEFKENTSFKNIFRFPHSQFVTCKLDKLIKKIPETKPYWEPPIGPIEDEFTPEKALQHAREYEELLDSAVKLRLRSDVKVGSALSGGLDSTSIVYLINKELKTKNISGVQETFSTVYTQTPGAEHCDESIFINELTEKLNVTSNQIEPNAADIPLEHEHMIYAMENPPANTCMSGWHTFKKVRSTDVKVTIDGQGADESLGGYISYLPIYLACIRKNVLKTALSFRNIHGTQRYIKVGLVYNALRFKWLQRFANYILKASGRNLQPGVPINKRFAIDMQAGLTNLLHYLDRTSMYFSLESRLPFLDYRLVEKILNIPATYKYHDGWTKYIARKAMDKKLPDSIVWRKDKMGWPIPENLWFTGPLKDWIITTVESSDFIKEVSPKFSIRNAIEKQQITLAIRYLNLAVWHRLYFIEHAYKNWDYAKNNH